MTWPESSGVGSCAGSVLDSCICILCLASGQKTRPYSSRTSRQMASTPAINRLAASSPHYIAERVSILHTHIHTYALVLPSFASLRPIFLPRLPPNLSNLLLQQSLHHRPQIRPLTIAMIQTNRARALLNCSQDLMMHQLTRE